MRGRFLTYDQQEMVRRFGLEHDREYLYIEFVGRKYRVSRADGTAEWSEDGFRTVIEADYNESMTIYDVLCDSKADCRLAGTFCPIQRARGVPRTLASGEGIFQKAAERFRGRTEALKHACRLLGARELDRMAGDAAFELHAFSFLPVLFQYWDADEEFPPSLKFMFDENILDYMRFETVHFMIGHILGRMEGLMDGADQ